MKCGVWGIWGGVAVGLLLGTGLASDCLGGPPMQRAPANIQAALVTKLLALNRQINQGTDVLVYVVGDAPFAAAMKPAVGRTLGKSKLKAVQEGKVPTEKIPTLRVLYVGDPKQWPAAKAYCRKYQVLSISGRPELLGKGVTLVVGVADRKPKIVLDMAASKAEKMVWEDKVLKLAAVVNAK